MAVDKPFVVIDTDTNMIASTTFYTYDDAATHCLNLCNRVNNHAKFVVKEFKVYKVLIDCLRSKEITVNAISLEDLKLSIANKFNQDFYFEDECIVSAENDDILGTYEML
jgi:hypothetical protein